jgi:hypothetical protein
VPAAIAAKEIAIGADASTAGQLLQAARPADRANAERLITMAEKEFTQYGSKESLSEAEERLAAGAALDFSVYCGLGNDAEDQMNKPTRAENWGSERIGRADVIRWLFTN